MLPDNEGNNEDHTSGAKSGHNEGVIAETIHTHLIIPSLKKVMIYCSHGDAVVSILQAAMWHGHYDPGAVL